jgi:hypothetical protein
MALLDGRVDAAVRQEGHSFQLPHGICSAQSPKGTTRPLISNGRTLDDLPPAARIGTSGLRRNGAAAACLPSIRIANLRECRYALKTGRRRFDNSVILPVVEKTWPRIRGQSDSLRRSCFCNWTGCLVLPAIRMHPHVNVSQRRITSRHATAVTAERGLLAAPKELQGSDSGARSS